MILVRGRAAGTELTGTIYEPRDEPPTFRGAPDEGAPYTWVCDEFYQVDSGGSTQTVAGREIQVAFETPLPRGFDTREAAVAAAREHVRTQFARIGVRDAAVSVDDAADDALRDGSNDGDPDDDLSAEDGRFSGSL